MASALPLELVKFNSASVCVWTCAQFSNFYKSYLIPRFKKDSIDVKLMWFNLDDVSLACRSFDI